MEKFQNQIQKDNSHTLSKISILDFENEEKQKTYRFFFRSNSFFGHLGFIY